MLPSNSGVDKNLKALDKLLKDKPDDYKGRVLEYVRASNIDADDPTFILIAAQGSLDIALEKLPIEFRGIVALAIEELRGIVALASSNTNTVLLVYARNAERRQEEGELLKAKLTALADKLEQVPSQIIEAVTEAMREIVLAQNQHDRYVVDTIVANSTQLAEDNVKAITNDNNRLVKKVAELVLKSDRGVWFSSNQRDVGTLIMGMGICISMFITQGGSKEWREGVDRKLDALAPVPELHIVPRASSVNKKKHK
jgi:hypothetical protein